MASINEHDHVVLTVDLPEHRLAAGDVGVVVHVYGDGSAFEVEFVALDGETCAIVTVSRDHVRSVGRRELVHARRMA